MAKIKKVSAEGHFNPYPGLRPFQIDESHLFFGREGQTDEVLQKLADNRFVGIIGPSGSGKSSFVYCGVLPILFGGFLTNTGPNWDVIVLRPGSSPIENLAAALLEKDPTHADEPEEDHEVRKQIITTLLRSNSNGLAEAIKQIKQATNMNYLILVDQFEELFRYKKSADNKHASEDTHTFINLLMKAVDSEDDAYYVSITMRSDFIGECAQFAELTRKINDSHYLIPQLTRDQKRKAIEGPASVGNGDVTKRLIHRLLNDLGENPDQLPILQHALMRTWEYWAQNREGADAMDLKHYEAIGTMEEALSMHADEAYNDLNEEQKRICEVLFKTITEKRGTFGIRRPTKLKEIAAIAGCKNKELAEVVLTFRKPGRSFLTPMYGIKLNSDSVIDISHESLMRIWVRLKHWVDEEAESVNMYLRLAEAGELYQVGKGGLWRPPNLQLALNWQVKNKPTLEWGQRYDPAFERTMSFMEYSKKEYDNEQKVKELQLKRKQRNQRIFVGVLASATIVSVMFLIIALQAQTEAEKQFENAKEQTAIAEFERDAADSAKTEAQEQERRATLAKEDAILQKLRADSLRIEATIAKDAADTARLEAERQKNYAEIQEQEAKKQTVIANEQTDLAKNSLKKALVAEAQTKKERFTGLSKYLGSKAASNIPDPQLKGLLAKQGFNFNKEYSGFTYDANISVGLYEALTNFGDPMTAPLAGHAKEVYSIQASPIANKMYSAGTLGRILEWDLDNPEATPKIIAPVRASASIKGGVSASIQGMDISKDGQWLVVAGVFGSSSTPDETYLELYNLQTNAKSTIKGVLKEGSAVQFLDENRILFIDNVGKRLNMVNRDGSGFRTIYTSETEIKDMAFSPTDRSIVVAELGKLKFIQVSDGTVLQTIDEIDQQTDNPIEIEALSFSKDGKLMAFGDSEGALRIMDAKSHELTKVITDHKSPITDVDFNTDGDASTFIATSSLDNTARIYHITEINEPPITFTIRNTHLYTVEFTRDNQYVFVGAEQKILKKFPIESSIMADKICDYITREFYDEEWEAYVGEDVEKENTCGVVTSRQEPE